MGVRNRFLRLSCRSITHPGQEIGSASQNRRNRSHLNRSRFPAIRPTTSAQPGLFPHRDLLDFAVAGERLNLAPARCVHWTQVYPVV